MNASLEIAALYITPQAAIGKSISEIDPLGLNWGATTYPVVEDGIVTRTVDANYPLEYNDGNWEIIANSYAQACEPEKEDEN